MNETENTSISESEAVNEESRGVRIGGRRVHPAVLAGAGVVGAALVFFGVWFFGFRDSGDAGKPVPAPRTTSMDEMAPTETLVGKTLTISPEQLESSGISIETIGETLAAEVGLTAATGVIEPNAYRNSPALPLAGGIVHSVTPELGEAVSKGQTVAIVFSNDYAEAQSRYITLLTEVE